MGKTQEELTQLKTEYESLNSKLKELTDDELKLVTGGNLPSFVTQVVVDTYKDQLEDTFNFYLKIFGGNEEGLEKIRHQLQDRIEDLYSRNAINDEERKILLLFAYDLIHDYRFNNL